jgi:hypothetical protein
MWKFAVGLIIALALTQSIRSAAADTAAKPSSFIPHSAQHTHTYGSPIQPSIVGHKNSHHKQAPKSQSWSAAT